MKRLFSAAGLFTVLASTTYSYGQTSVAQADIPFPFQAGETTMPAGKYIVRESGDLLTVRSETGKSGIMILTLPAEHRSKASHPSLEFQRYGRDYFLTKIWHGGAQDGRALPVSNRQRELARRATFERTEQVALQTGSSHVHNVK